MRSRVRAAGHTVHPILIVFPLGLLTTSAGFDILYLITDRATFAFTAAHLIAAGVLMGVVTAATGRLGGELVERLGISVGEDAHPDAPSSLGGVSASDR